MLPCGCGAPHVQAGMSGMMRRWNSKTAHPEGQAPMGYSEYKCFHFRFESGVAFVSIDHPPINLLDETLSQEFDQLSRALESDESIRVVVLQSALPEFFIAHSGLGRVGAAPKVVSHTRNF